QEWRAENGRHSAGAGEDPSTSDALWPPKPNEFESATPVCSDRGSSATTSMAMAGSVWVWLAVGGTNLWCSANTEVTASAAPAAPTRWPVTPLVPVTGTACSPNTLVMAAASASSFSGVDVPWALMLFTSAGDSPASSRAWSMHAAAPAPLGDGAVMWKASQLRP